MFQGVRRTLAEGWRLAKLSLAGAMVSGCGLALVATLPEPPAVPASGVRAGQTAARASGAMVLEAAVRPMASGNSATASDNSVEAGRPTEVVVPIVMYHHTPADFDQQLAHLEQSGYTVIDMDQTLAGLHGAALPARPVVLTFDDGFADQLQAFNSLKARNMKATFYIIAGGEASLWCIGADRRYGDPLQPANGCGDGYMTWDDVRRLDQTGLVTIGGHTFNHFDLTTLPVTDQGFEIAGSKAAIERQLGHEIRHFAYPGGGHNDETVRLVEAAGYGTAVTTLPGQVQPAGSQYRLRRVRDVWGL